MTVAHWAPPATWLSGPTPCYRWAMSIIKGKKREAISVLDEFGWEPVKLMSKEELALLNGTQFMSANGVFAILKACLSPRKPT